MNNTELFRLMVEILLVAVTLYLAFFKSYFTEKGKNVATKEDIEEITAKVETIKTQFIRETEQLKINLQFQNTVKASIYQERKDAVIDLYEQFNVWYHSVSDLFHKSFEFSAERITQAKEDTWSYHEAFSRAESKLELYVDDPKLTAAIKNIRDKMLEYGHEMHEYYESVERHFVDAAMYVSIPTKIEKLNSEKYERYMATLRKHFELVRDLAPLQTEFKEQCYRVMTMVEPENV